MLNARRRYALLRMQGTSLCAFPRLFVSRIYATCIPHCLSLRVVTRDVNCPFGARREVHGAMVLGHISAINFPLKPVSFKPVG